MKRIRNKTVRPIRIPLGGGKVLHLNPAKEAQIADSAVEREALQRLVKQGSVEIIGEGERPETWRPSERAELEIYETTDRFGRRGFASRRKQKPAARAPRSPTMEVGR